ncbi:MAG TPA: YolD-like family protein [Cerasibacillus sp.]|uniref:YolD-like family protein n=1 Tax=Cerasibacillus sp. TaxID=2498711 RepID=UPI002F4112F0
MNDHIKDRGTKKWTSIMLPEHVKALRELNKELDKVQKPILDEQKIWENEVKLQMA